MRRVLSRRGDIVVTHEVVDGKTVLGYTQDCEKHIERNKRLLSTFDASSSSKDYRQEASVMQILIMKWLIEDGIKPLQFMRWPTEECTAYLRRKYYDPDYRHLLTSPHSVKSPTAVNPAVPYNPGLSSEIERGRRLGM